ncbi:MAG: type I 3-dehydroquinate dehydratase [Lachnospiraceae bacterium]|jgi:3-dehydroquinate dehydratase-1|nr:type I 3-dehydroquinate dehydratase [Lachnospiraceae bacterium]
MNKPIKSVSAGNIVIGEGDVKICVPILGTTAEEILNNARKAAESPADFFEWRADYFLSNTDDQINILIKLHEICGERPIIFTYRRIAEGGMSVDGDEQYLKVLCKMADERAAEIFDIEATLSEQYLNDILSYVKNNGIKVVLSHHDFKRIPPDAELLSLYRTMHATDADIIKLAVMPETPEDVQRFIEVSSYFYSNEAKKPLIAIAMGEMGSVTRVNPASCGSCVSFAVVDEAFVAGQQNVYELAKILKVNK